MLSCASIPVMQCLVLTSQALQAMTEIFLLHLAFDVCSLMGLSVHVCMPVPYVAYPCTVFALKQHSGLILPHCI